MTQDQSKNLAPHILYAMISELAYHLGEERRRNGADSDMARDWLEAESEVNALLCANQQAH